MAYSDELQLGMHHLIDCLELWLNEIFDTEFDNEASIEIYNAVKLSSNSDRIRATERFNNKKEYSNVTIKWTISGQEDEEDELVFGQVCLLINSILYFFSYN